MDKSAGVGDGLSPLTPIYDEKHHASYATHLVTAITSDPPVHNVALAGAYGTGKSSILQGVKQALSDSAGRKARIPLVEISLSNINEPSEKVAKASGEPSLSAVLQKEVVKRLLYSQSPHQLPLSRFKRIADFRRKRAIWIALGATAILWAILFLVFGPSGINQYFEGRSLAPWLGAGLGSLVSIGILFTVQYFMHQHAVHEVSFGAASIKLSDAAGNYFDQFLDEIIYFFKRTGTRYVFFEDLDRFNDPDIFRALRDLNSILNAALPEEKHVAFVYAVRDSLFEPGTPDLLKAPGASNVSENPEPATNSPIPESTQSAATGHRYGVSSPASDRSKFFDLIIPIVPFISPEVSADLLHRELKSRPIADDARPSQDLVELAGRYFTDMRVIHSIANEFQIYANELLGKSKLSGLDPNKQLAMILYKHAHLADYERIRSGDSKLDQIVKKVREVAHERLQVIDKTVAQLRTEIPAADKVKTLSETMGARLQSLLEIGAKSSGVGAGASVLLEPSQRTFQWQDLKTEAFWTAYAAQPGALILQNGARFQVRLTTDELEKFIDKVASIAAWHSRAQKEVNDRVRSLSRLRARNVEATFTQRVTDRSLWDTNLSAAIPDLTTYAHEVLEDGLALDLMRSGYLDNNFALYASVYYGDLRSVDARSFMLQVMDQHETAPDFKLSNKDVEAILKQPGYDFLNTRSALNVSVFEHLIDNDRLEPTIRRLVAGTLDQNHVFVRAFLARSKAASRLVVRLSPTFDKILNVIAGNEQLEPDVKLRLVSTALANLDSKVDYDASDATLELIAENIDSLPVLREELSSERSSAFAKFLSQNSIKLESVQHLPDGTRDAVMEVNAFEVNLPNLTAITPSDGQVGIDTLSEVQDSLADYLLQESEAYLGSLESAEAQLFSVDTPARLIEVLELATNLDDDSSDRLLQLAHPDAMVERFTDAPASSWPSLARTKRFMPTALNLTTYLKSEQHVGSHRDLARSLATTSAILSENEASDDDKTELAVWLVNQEEIPSPVTLRLLSQLNPPNPLPLASLHVLDGQLLAGLISARHVGDTVETFNHFGSLPWSEKELALAKSTNLPGFVTRLELQSDEYVGVITSSLISGEAKAAVFLAAQSLHETKMLTLELATVLVDFAATASLGASGEELSTLARAGAPSERIAKVLGQRVDDLTKMEILDVLSQLRGEYKKLAAADGKKPRIEDDNDVRRLLDMLKAKNHVSDYRTEKKDDKFLRVFMKRHQS